MEKNKKLACPLCLGNEFQEEKGKVDSSWGMTAHKVKMFICKKCNYVMFFGEGRSIFDFD